MRDVLDVLNLISTSGDYMLHGRIVITPFYIVACFHPRRRGPRSGKYSQTVRIRHNALDVMQISYLVVILLDEAEVSQCDIVRRVVVRVWPRREVGTRDGYATVRVSDTARTEIRSEIRVARLLRDEPSSVTSVVETLVLNGQCAPRFPSIGCIRTPTGYSEFHY